MATNKHFKAMHKSMQAWFDKQAKKGWESPEQHDAATRVLWELWSLSRTKAPPAVMMQSLKEDSERLRKATLPDDAA